MNVLICAPEYVYYIFAGLVYGCIASVAGLAVFFGCRAMRNVKREQVRELKKGFSPLDVQRIFIGKTYPSRLTRALIVHWAERGLISVEYVDARRVTLVKKSTMPDHDSPKAVFFDRGTYVRERRLFNKVFGIKKRVTVDINRSLVKRKDWNEINKSFSVREDDGVYSSVHYALKVFTTVLSIAPLFIAALWFTLDGVGAAIIFPFIAMLGFFVLRFMREIPLPFRMVWCSMWLGAPIGALIGMTTWSFDPLGISYAASVMLFLGSFVLIQFVDYREKNNLSDYSDLVNYRKFLWRATAGDVDYYAALPYLYAFGIKPFTAKKLRPAALPAWYKGAEGGLL